jgi:hypothetical protein
MQEYINQQSQLWRGLGRDRGHRGNLARPQVPRASECGGVWVRRAGHRGLVGPCGSSWPSKTRVSDQQRRPERVLLQACVG